MCFPRTFINLCGRSKELLLSLTNSKPLEYGVKMSSLQSMVGKVLAGVLVVSSFAMVTAGERASATSPAATTVAPPTLNAHTDTSFHMVQFQDPNPRSMDEFGFAVSLSADGNVAVVGADNFSEHEHLNEGQGAMYVFMRSVSGWNLATTLSPTDLVPGDRCGISVSVTPSANQIVVGCMGELEDSVPKAYIFLRPLNGWDASPTVQQTTELTTRDPLSTASAGMYWGSKFYAVSQSDDGATVVVSSPYQGVSGIGAAGEVFLYQAPVGGWLASESLSYETRVLLPSLSSVRGFFGQSIAIAANGSRIFVTSGGSNHTFVYDRPSEGWSASSDPLLESAQIAVPQAWSLATSWSGDEILIGGADPTASRTPKIVYVYQYIDGSWRLTSSLSPPTKENDPSYMFGYSVSLSPDGQVALIGDQNKTVIDQTTSTSVGFAGAVYAFADSEGAGWSNAKEITSPTPRWGGNFGLTLAILSSGDFLIGEPALLTTFAPSSNARRGGLQAGSPIPHASSGSVPGTAFAGSVSWLAQKPLFLSHTSLGGVVGTPISLSTTGGSGIIAPTFVATGAGCSISGARLSASHIATCVVTATNPANGNFSIVQSDPVTFHFLSPQPLLKISNSKLSGVAGTAVKLTTTGGTGLGVLSFSVAGANCTLSGSSLNATGLAQCVVTATKAASGSSGPVVSPTVKFTFALAAQAALKVSNSVKKGTVGTAVKLTASGGSGPGSLNFSVTGSGCAISGQLLTTTKAGNCSLKATKAASGIYAVAVSPAVVFTFTAKK